MRFYLLIACCAISLNTSAQFWKKKVRYPAIAQVPAFVAPAFNLAHTNVKSLPLLNFKLPVVFDFDKVEQAVMKQAKHNMRFRVYQEAGYNFSDLAKLYLLHNRYSEAKWYLLQSNALTHDTKLLLGNLLVLAGIKTDLGEVALAKTDLQQARALAANSGLKADVAEIDKRLLLLNNQKAVTVKPELRYSEAVEAAARQKKTLLN
ncbi:hypothetical protein [Mucilaginibacter auburnensis]|uniref:MalT-like TPR region domain-containing protein n=1 Tax=Mucilaginibacter auburnensis TaxID=1457233 RepID=A0A2H9VPJ7_9SPHI|nr:hypothetical protein [Mucilaginibacter auburnensis]PJJ80241.1 hypothetical protein CLV57_3388 [Mucilaginibacter auburnensis]